MKYTRLIGGLLLFAALRTFGQHDDATCDHDHANETPHADEERGEHDHEADEGAEDGVLALEQSAERLEKLGVRIREAAGALLVRTVRLPAEIRLDRDHAASVSPRYASVVRQVFVEWGDSVREGDVLASLENRDTLAVYTVSAPFDGVVVSRDLAPGEAVDPESVLFEVADLSRVWAEITVFPRDRSRIRIGMPVVFRSDGGREVRGEVQYIAPVASEQTRTFVARCVLSGGLEGFAPGLFVQALIGLDRAEVAVAVPREAVQTIDGRPVVFVLSDHGFEAVDVELGMADAQSVEIRHGLVPGERYVAEGAFVLKAQMITQGMDPHAGHGH